MAIVYVDEHSSEPSKQAELWSELMQAAGIDSIHDCSDSSFTSSMKVIMCLLKKASQLLRDPCVIKGKDVDALGRLLVCNPGALAALRYVR